MQLNGALVGCEPLGGPKIWGPRLQPS